jgi:Flp pilus assembly pilin Flp
MVRRKPMHTLDERRGRAGQALAEYALLLAMVAIIVVVIVLFLSGKLQVVVDAIGSR